jgi:hypothetical protein
MAIANADQSARESLLEERLVAARGTGSAG